jgi:hypothetical protein
MSAWLNTGQEDRLEDLRHQGADGFDSQVPPVLHGTMFI